jgi:hypothetical protein
MVLVVRCWPLTAETQVCTWVSPYGICGGRSGSGTEFFGFPVSIIQLELHTYISSGG